MTRATRERRAPARNDERRSAEPGLGAPGKDDAVPAGYKMTEIGVIPVDWEVTTVGEEFYVQLGKMLDVEKNVGVSKPFLGNRAVQWGRIDANDIGSIKLTPSDLRRFRLRDGDLLVCEGGEIGRAAIWQREIAECYYQKALHRLRPKHSYSMTLMLNVLQRFASTGFLLNYATQTSIAHLPKDKFETVPIPLPPTRAEQRAIATALSDVDELIESLEKLIAKKRAIKTGTMQQLLTPPGQPGHKRLPGFSGEWEVKRLGDFGSCHRGVSYKPDADLSTCDTESTCRLLRANNVQDSGVFLRNMQYVNSRCVSFDQRLRSKDVLVCMANGSRVLVGKAGQFSAEDEYSYTFGAFMGVFRPDTEAFHPDLAFFLFNTEAYRRHIAILLAGSSINNLTPRSIEEFQISVPVDLSEQSAIAAILSDMDAEIEALEARRVKTRAIKQGMMQELLTGRVRLV